MPELTVEPELVAAGARGGVPPFDVVPGAVR
jgi:hypothetical protein